MIKPFCRAGLLLLTLLAGPHLAAAASPEPQPATPDAKAMPAKAMSANTMPAKTAGSDAQQFCQNIAAAATDARFAWQTQQLNDLDAKIKQRVAELDAKRAELKDVLTKRDEAMKRAQESLVAIYAKMKPDVAAAQLSALDDTTASAVLAQLNPRTSSAILNEVSPDRAVRLINTIAGTPDGKKS